jgi:HAD superfamily hydrolase (TIGR01662 family)
VTYDVVIPSTRRDSLAALLGALAAGRGPAPGRVIVVDDLRGGGPLALPGGMHVEVIDGPGRGPAAARNAGMRATQAEWIAFLDDDVITPPGWRTGLCNDLRGLPEDVAASQGRIVVPLPAGRRPTDWERNVAGLESARWATADMAYRRSALEAVGGFDERFRRAYREDADLGLRIVDAGFEIRTGSRHVLHPVGSAPASVSVRLQAGNADDALMRALHGPGWRERAGAPPGRLRRHLAATGSLAAAGAAAAAGRRRAALAGAALWACATAELAWERIAPGPRRAGEVAKMVWTSALLPPAASAHALAGLARARRLAAEGAPALLPAAERPRPARPRAPAAVLLDRDGTLVEDVPYNGDPAAVRPMPGARQALDRLRGADIRLAVVSNQSGIGRGLLSRAQVESVNARVEELLGPLGPWLVCPHAPRAGCDCRKPAPGLILEAAQALHVDPAACVVIGDIGADMEAARAAGSQGILVPTPRTRAEEVEAAPLVVESLLAAVDRILGARSAVRARELAAA